MTDGGTGVRGYQRERSARDRMEMELEANSVSASPGWRNGHKAALMMGAESIVIHEYPDSRFDTVAVLDLAQMIESHLDRIRPGIVFTHFPSDLNQDHRRTTEAVLMACRPKPSHPVQHILFYEVASSTEWNIPATFQPNVFVNITDFQEQKEKVLSEAYGREMRDTNHPRSVSGIYAQTSWRGSTVGVEVAEAFVLGRSIIR